MRMKPMLAIALLMAALSSCAPQSGSGSPSTTTPAGPFATWALGDSQGAPSDDPARGLAWTQLIGEVGNGAVSMEGAGWSVTGPHSGLTVPQKAQQIVDQHGAVDFVVMAGVNDLGAGRTVTEMLQGVANLEVTAANAGVEVVYVGIVPITQGSYVAPRDGDRIAFNKALATQFPGRYVDCSASMSIGQWLNPAFALGAANLHLNAAGEQALAGCIAPSL